MVTESVYTEFSILVVIYFLVFLFCACHVSCRILISVIGMIPTVAHNEPVVSFFSDFKITAVCDVKINITGARTNKKQPPE